MTQEKILVVDDEKEIAELIRDYLRAEGFEVFLAHDGEEAVNCFREHKPQLVVLDIMLPKMDGTEVCRIIRDESNIPILMVSAKKSDVDKILALGLGADDYMTKPFSPGEMVARVKAQLRRFTKLSALPEEKEKLLYGDLEIDLKGYGVTLAGKSILLSAKEFELLRYLAQNPNQVLTREQIFDRVWSFNDFGDINTVTVHIRRIREKMEPDPAKPIFIKTVWGVGYKFTGGKS